MKIAITGHTKGIGQALYHELVQKGHDVYGYSRSNGYDICKEIDIDRILMETNDFDVFINNAYYPNSQLYLLKNKVQQWDNQKKLIINVASKAVHTEVVPEFMKDYIRDKKSQIDFIMQRKLKASPQILNLVVGLVDTEMSKSLSAKKLKTQDIAELLCNLITFKDRIYVQDLMIDVPYQDWTEIRPANQ